MKKIFTLLVFTAITQLSYAQRYLEPIFSDVTVIENEIYAANSTVLLLPQIGGVAKVPLFTDIYMPVGDTETNRPLVMVFHTGNFLPPMLNQQIAGHNKDSSVVFICTELAKRGYVAAAVTYRSGWNPAATDQPTRALGLIQAAYRGMQDGRAAARYFRLTAAAAGNPYGIDPNKITAWGNGTGGYLVLGLAGLSDYGEIVQTTNGPGKFLLDLDMDGTPETPMVVPAYHGDINGVVETIAPDGAFGIPGGDTTNFAFHTQMSSDIQMSVNIGGALGDISWFNDITIPTITVQSAFDQFAPYDDDVLVVPTTGDAIVRVQGGKQIGMKQEELGNNQIWKDANFTDPITMKAKANSAIAGHPYYEGLFPIVKPRNSLGFDEGVVINWWNPTDIAAGIGIPGVPSPFDGVPLNMAPHPSDSTITYHTQGMFLNEGMSAAKSKANIDTIMQYVLPRMFLALDLEVSSTTNIDAAEIGLSIAPNPSMGTVRIQTKGIEFQAVRVFDLQGKMVSNASNLSTTSFDLERNGIPNGMYIVQLQLENGISTQKLIFN